MRVNVRRLHAAVVDKRDQAAQQVAVLPVTPQIRSIVVLWGCFPGSASSAMPCFTRRTQPIGI
jgi:hypothetical protein